MWGDEGSRGDDVASSLCERLREMVDSPREEAIEVVARERAVGARWQAMTLKHDVKVAAERLPNLRQVGRRSLLADAGVRRPVNQGVVQHRVDFAPSVDVFQEPSWKD